MPVLEKLNIGLVGAAGRGGSFRSAFEANGARVHAVCDLDEERLQERQQSLGAAESYSDYAAMIERSELDAVVIGTPQHLHASQAVMALRRNLHVLSEVPAAVSVDEARDLVHACNQSRGIYMMAENYTYTRQNVLIREIARQGLFGDLYYAEGEYLHELKGLAEITTWRRKWQMGIDGITYPTHSLGPILQWMSGDRVTRVSCEGSGHHYDDPRGEPYHQDTSVMLCKTMRGALIKIRLDLVSERPHAMNNHQLQGTRGVYESRRAPGEKDRIWLQDLSSNVQWHDLDSLASIDSLAERYLPAIWRNPPSGALQGGHGGGDYFEVLDFVRAIRGEAPCPIGIHEAMDMTVPGLISQQSIAQGGRWLEAPDSRSWLNPVVNRPQLQMIWPERLLKSPPSPHVPQGYVLRRYQDDDESQYIRLMDSAGFTGWTHESVRANLQHILPGGFFVIVEQSSGKLVATAVANHSPTPTHPFGGELGWVAADPAHSGKGLGLAVSAAATARLLHAGYERIYLLTDDVRLPAINTYLKLGYEPLILDDDMRHRWQQIHQNLAAGSRHPA